MTPNPLPPPASDGARHAGEAGSSATALDDLGYECAMPHLWADDDVALAGRADWAARPDDVRP